MTHNAKVLNFDRGKPSDNDPIDARRHLHEKGQTLGRFSQISLFFFLFFFEALLFILFHYKFF